MGRNFFVSQLFFKPPYPTASFEGQTVIVTGSNSGLGKEAARHVARLGARKVIIAVRNVAAGEEARKSIIATTNCTPDTLEVWHLDLASSESVQAFARRAVDKLERIDVLLENAAINTKRYLVADGHEQTLTVNVISAFLLALLLLPKLKETAQEFKVQPRIALVVSEVHGWTKFPEAQSNSIFHTLDAKESANMDKRYFLSKLLDVLLVRHLAPMMVGSGVILTMLNPGLCYSELTREMDGSFLFWLVKKLLARPTEVGSRTLLAAASAGQESHGAYMSDCEVMNDMVSKYAQSQEGAEAGRKVWAELKSILEDIHPGVTADFQ